MAATIGKGIVDPGIIDQYVIFGALTGAIVWNVITCIYGIPSSSSHALIGGLVGAGVAKVGTGSLVASGLIKTMGQKITKLKPVGGFCAESGGAITLSWRLFLAYPYHGDSRSMRQAPCSTRRYRTRSCRRFARPCQNSISSGNTR